MQDSGLLCEDLMKQACTSTVNFCLSSILCGKLAASPLEVLESQPSIYNRLFVVKKGGTFERGGDILTVDSP